jgi:predicted small lipoprotein YifL
MKNFAAISSTIAVVLLLVVSACAQKNPPPADNAALRYWSAFSQVQDSAITDQQAKELNAILDGTSPYVDSNYKDLLEKNKLALEIMARATSLLNCDWGLDYGLGDDLPVDYARKALVLGRLNVLYSFHLFIGGNKDEGVRTLTAGLRFSRDVGNGGSLFATLIAKDLLVSHLKAAAGVLHLEQLSTEQRSRLQKAIAGLGQGLDWQTAAKLDLEALRPNYAVDAQTSAALTKIISAYVAFLSDQSKLPLLNQAIESAPQQLAGLVPNARRVLEQKQDLNDMLLQIRSSLQ